MIEPYYDDGAGRVIYCGDCREVLPQLGVCAHAVVTDPPYGLEFMGKDWDHGIPGEHFWQIIGNACLPGANLLAFGGTRTSHRLVCAIEDAGWEIRDTLLWLYGSGFPKSLDVSKAIDKAAGAEGSWRQEDHPGRPGKRVRGLDGTFGDHQHIHSRPDNPDGLRHIYEPATPAARTWQGYGTALKPAHEPICLAMKPLDGTFAQNAQKHGIAGVNVDGCRVGTDERHNGSASRNDIYGQFQGREAQGREAQGRWPANVIHDGSDEVVERFPNVKAGVAVRRNGNSGKGMFPVKIADGSEDVGYGDTGSAARFFYTAKASKADRTPGNNHPTVKPISLMRYLCRLLAMPERTVILDPFLGSGATMYAAREEGLHCIGIELNEEYAEIAANRLAQKVLF